MSYLSGKTIRLLREKKNYTQKQLAERIGVSEKTVSKWETKKGLPDISLLEPLAKELQISVAEPMNGFMMRSRLFSKNLTVFGNKK